MCLTANSTGISTILLSPCYQTVSDSRITLTIEADIVYALLFLELTARMTLMIPTSFNKRNVQSTVTLRPIFEITGSSSEDRHSMARSDLVQVRFNTIF